MSFAHFMVQYGFNTGVLYAGILRGGGDHFAPGQILGKSSM